MGAGRCHRQGRRACLPLPYFGIRPFHGKCRRKSCGLLERHREYQLLCRRCHLGLGGPGHQQLHPRRHEVLGLWRRFRRQAQRRHVLHERHHASRPLAEGTVFRGEEGLSECRCTSCRHEGRQGGNLQQELFRRPFRLQGRMESLRGRCAGGCQQLGSRMPARRSAPAERGDVGLR